MPQSQNSHSVALPRRKFAKNVDQAQATNRLSITDPRIHGSCHLRIYNVSWLQGGDTRTGCILLSNQPASSCVWHARVSGFSVVCPLLVMAGPIDEHFLSRFRSLVAGRRSLLVQERLCRLVTCLIHRQRCYLAHPSCCLSPLLGIL